MEVLDRSVREVLDGSEVEVEGSSLDVGREKATERMRVDSILAVEEIEEGRWERMWRLKDLRADYIHANNVIRNEYSH